MWASDGALTVHVASVWECGFSACELTAMLEEDWAVRLRVLYWERLIMLLFGHVGLVGSFRNEVGNLACWTFGFLGREVLSALRHWCKCWQQHQRNNSYGNDKYNWRIYMIQVLVLNLSRL